MSKSAWAVVIIGAALIAVYVLIPTSKDLELSFWTRADAFDLDDAEDVTFYINDRAVGGPRVQFRANALPQFFLSELTPEHWPPANAPSVDFDCRITDQLRFDVRVFEQNEQEPRMHVVYVRIDDDGQVTQGAFRIKATNARGQTAYCAGAKLLSKSVEDKRISAAVQIQLHF